MFSLGESIAGVGPWLQQYGYWAFCVALMLENVLFTSMVVPGLFVLVAAGFLAGGGELDLRILLLGGICSAWIGDSISYCLGRFLWGRVLARTRLGAAVSRLQPVLQQRRKVFLVLYHFEPAARMVGGTLAGASGLSIRNWLPFDFLGAALWVPFYTLVGYVLGRLGRSINDWETLRPVGVAALLVLLIWLWSFNRAVKRSLAETGTSGASSSATNKQHI